jgi:acetyltransferase-like isoleucine patch superfamily enzyme
MTPHRVVSVLRHPKDSFLNWLAASVATRARVQLAEELLTQIRVFGPKERLHIAPTAVVNDSLFNLSSGDITVGEWGMLAHGVTILTGTHDMTQFGPARHSAVPRTGRDVTIGEGAWLASNVTVIGPSNIGAHAVVAAGSVVRGDVDAYAIVAGVPARLVGYVDH